MNLKEIKPYKAKQFGRYAPLDSLAVRPFAHGYAILTQMGTHQVCRCWRRYE